MTRQAHLACQHTEALFVLCYKVSRLIFGSVKYGLSSYLLCVVYLTEDRFILQKKTLLSLFDDKLMTLVEKLLTLYRDLESCVRNRIFPSIIVIRE